MWFWRSQHGHWASLLWEASLVLLIPGHHSVRETDGKCSFGLWPNDLSFVSIVIYKTFASGPSSVKWRQ